MYVKKQRACRQDKGNAAVSLRMYVGVMLYKCGEGYDLTVSLSSSACEELRPVNDTLRLYFHPCTTIFHRDTVCDSVRQWSEVICMYFKAAQRISLFNDTKQLCPLSRCCRDNSQWQHTHNERTMMV